MTSRLCSSLLERQASGRREWLAPIRSIFIFLLFLSYSLANGQPENIVRQRGELDKIKSEIGRRRNTLDSLQKVEKKVLKEMADYEQRASVNETVLSRLNRQLNLIRTGIQKSKINITESQSRLNLSRTRYLENLKYYYAETISGQMGQNSEIEKEKDAINRLLYLKALATYNREALVQSSEYLKQAEDKYGDLVSREKTVGDVQKKKKSEYTLASSQKEKRERELSRLRRKKQGEADRLVSLSAEARQMEELIARLEKVRREREKSSEPTEFNFSTGNFATFKGRLLAPIDGRVIKGFGWSVDQLTKLRAFSPGIEMYGKKKDRVIAAADGVVAYIGDIRGYGIFVIVEHEDGYYSTYAGLDNLVVEQGQIVKRGEKLGTNAMGNIKFELRHGKESINPIEWIKIDYSK
ncbi:MAG: peptidoglycan DD-metalloendopeptidase family protein [candidate division Zixibacteria bacterium]|nr:peptidoglycan DD-metalloendopeptidase family protein [candidate division Zixibacteria bacterium]